MINYKPTCFKCQKELEYTTEELDEIRYIVDTNKAKKVMNDNTTYVCLDCYNDIKNYDVMSLVEELQESIINYGSNQVREYEEEIKRVVDRINKKIEESKEYTENQRLVVENLVYAKSVDEILSVVGNDKDTLMRVLLDRVYVDEKYSLLYTYLSEVK